MLEVCKTILFIKLNCFIICQSIETHIYIYIYIVSINNEYKMSRGETKRRIKIANEKARSIIRGKPRQKVEKLPIVGSIVAGVFVVLVIWNEILSAIS